MNSDGKRVGRADVRFNRAALTGPEQFVRDAIVRSAVVASLLGLAISLLTAWLITRRARPRATQPS